MRDPAETIIAATLHREFVENEEQCNVCRQRAVNVIAALEREGYIIVREEDT